MQYIENSVFGVRAALYTLARKIGAPRFLLFPMVHIEGPPVFKSDGSHASGTHSHALAIIADASDKAQTLHSSAFSIECNL